MSNCYIVVSHECSAACSACYGTGEGLYEGSDCKHCKGSGIAHTRGEVQEVYEVDYEGSKFLVSNDAMHVLQGEFKCPECGQDLTDAIIEELKSLIGKDIK